MYIEYEEICEREEQLEPDDKWGYLERDWDIYPTRVRKTPTNPRSSLEPPLVMVKNKNVSDVFVLFAQYSTGSTFGRETGCVQWIGIFEKDSDAEEARKILLKNQDETTKKSSLSFEGRYSVNIFGETIHKNWEGYFERLEDFRIKKVELV